MMANARKWRAFRGEADTEDSISYIKLDVHAARISVAIAWSGHDAPEDFGKWRRTRRCADSPMDDTGFRADGTIANGSELHHGGMIFSRER
ncbi:MAG: hypothetical protein JWM91_847 [Rhodospirillales bacterium]|nr:hypothetical protein [Rhodospirillales bacterium]